MHPRLWTISFGTFCLAVAANACGRHDTANAGVDTTPTASRSGAAAGAIESEDGWRAMLDTVRADDVPDSGARARALRSFAATARRQADSTNPVAARALLHSADELDSVAAGAERGDPGALRNVDSTIARLEQAESLDLVSRSVAAFSARQLMQAGQDLEAATTQFELAANDARIPLDARSARAAADARSVAARLQDNQIVSTQEFLRAVTALDKAARTLRSGGRD
jgi:hypothetical protein